MTQKKSPPTSRATPSTSDNKHPLSSQPFALSRTKILTSILVLSFLGFLDAIYLTILGFTRQIPPCTATHGCEKVLTSEFAYIGPIPIAALGVGYFIMVMILTIMLLQNFRQKTLQVLAVLTTAAFISGVILIGIQAFVLKAFCQYCLAAEAIMTFIFLITMYLYYLTTKKPFTPRQNEK